MSTFHEPYHFLQQSRGTQTTFFPVPKRKRKKKGEDNDFFDDIDPFTGVPDGFYRAFAIQSPLEQLPVIVQNRVGEGEARLAEFAEERPSESIGRPATTQSPSPSEANPIPLPRPRGNTFSEDEDTPPKSEKSSASLRRSSRQTSKSGRQGRGNRKRSGEQ